MRLVIVVIAAVWGIAGVWALVQTAERSWDARLTAVWFLAWPAIAVILFLNEPVPLWLSVPAVFGFIPWLLSGPHLWAVLKDPARSRPDEVAGIPRAYWLWGGLASVLLGLLFDQFA